MILREMVTSFWVIFKINKAPSIHLSLNDATLIRLNKINKIEEFFATEIKERETKNKRLNKYISAFHYIDKI